MTTTAASPRSDLTAAHQPQAANGLALVRVTIGVMVKRARTVAGLTQAQLAARAGTTQAVIARIEGGKAFTASLDLLDRIARALGGRLSVEFEGVQTRAA